MAALCLALAGCVTDGGQGTSAAPAGAAVEALRAEAALRDVLAAAPTARAEMPPPDPAAPMADPLTCLARTVYWESKGQPVEGQRAVAHVVLNRARASGYPDRVCEVVTQGGPSRPCQFSFYCDGRDDTPREPEAYETAHRVAWEALAGASADPTRGAVMFHNGTVRPSWARAKRRTATIGDHFFYR